LLKTRRMQRLLAICALAALGLAGCASPPPQEIQQTFLFRVESDPGVPLAGAELRRSGGSDQVLATSDDSGLVALGLRGRPGDRVQLEAACPEGHRSPTEPLSIVVRPLPEGAERPEYLVSCRPEQRSIVVAVRADRGANVPVRYLGKEIGRTDGDGVAHAALELTPGDSITLLLDTSSAEHRHLRPQNPSLKVTVPERDDVVVFDQPFKVERPKLKIKRELPQQVGPTRI
jgi:hypothetical protein